MERIRKPMEYVTVADVSAAMEDERQDLLRRQREKAVWADTFKDFYRQFEAIENDPPAAGPAAGPAGPAGRWCPANDPAGGHGGPREPPPPPPGIPGPTTWGPPRCNPPVPLVQPGLLALPSTAPSTAASTAQSSSYQGGVSINQANTASDPCPPWVKDPSVKRWN